MSMSPQDSTPASPISIYRAGRSATAAEDATRGACAHVFAVFVGMITPPLLSPAR